MTRDEYYVERAELGQALRDLRWERWAIQRIFRHAQDPCLIRAGSEWVTILCRMDVAICRKIIALDNRYQLEG